MQASLIISRNPYHPHTDRQISAIDLPVPVSVLAPVSQLPFICLYNGKPLLRGEWNTTIAGDQDTVHFVMLPQGGGGSSDPLRIVMSIAIMIAAIYFPPAMGLYGLAGAAAGAAISIAGSLLMNAILPAQATPQATRMSSLAAASPTYSLSAQGNAARIGQPVPVQYGRCKSWPDFAAAPYTDFRGGDQYLYSLLMLGQGEYDIEEMGIQDTPIAEKVGGGLVDSGNFDEVDWQVVEPGTAVTLFPASVTTSLEVAGQELEYNVQQGPYTLNASGTTINNIAFDLVCPKGLYYANDAGGLDGKSLTVQFYARLINDDGDPLEAWQLVAAVSLGGTGTGLDPNRTYGFANLFYVLKQFVTSPYASTTPLRQSFMVPVTAGRYEVYAIRTTTKDTSSRAGHDVNWSAARGYHPGNRVFPGKTVIALRMRATNSLSSMASRRIYVISTRKLLTWNSGTGWSATASVTRSIAWALADACKATYGKGLGDSRINLLQLEYLDGVWASRGDYFDARFDTLQGWWDALQSIARAGRTKAFQMAGIVNFVRDQQAGLPVVSFTNRNILPNSLTVDYEFADSETADGVNMTYFSSQYWADRTVMVPTTADQAADDSMFGVTTRAHATREAWYQWASNYYRRKFYKLQTEMEGCIPILLDPISISHDRVRYGQNGDVVGWDPATLTLTTSEPLTFTDGVQHYMALRQRDGSLISAIGCVPASTDDESLIDPITSWYLNAVTRALSGTTAPDGSAGYTITDATAASAGNTASSQTAIPYASGEIFMLDAYVEKDAVADRVVLLRATGYGGASSYFDCWLRTDTGDYETQATANASLVSISVVEYSGWWHVLMSGTIDASNPSIRVRFYPAVGPTLLTTDVATVGSGTLAAGVTLKKVLTTGGTRVKLATAPSLTPYIDPDVNLVEDISLWTVSNGTRALSGTTAPDGSAGYTITDATDTLYGFVTSAYEAYDGTVHYVDMFIAKDAVSDRVVLLRAINYNGTSYMDFRLRTDTGAYLKAATGGAAFSEWSVVDAGGGWWRVRFSGTVSGGTTIRLRFYAAIGGPDLNTTNAATMGSATIAGARLHKMVDTPYTGLNEERTTYAFGAGTGVELYQLCRVLTVRQVGEVTYEVYAVADYDEVHAADGGAMPAYPADEELSYSYTAPVITGLAVSQSISFGAPRLSIVWQPSPGATHYYVESSYDAGVNWLRLDDPIEAHYVAVFSPGDVVIRVAAVGLVRGPWSSWSGTIGTAVAPPPDVAAVSLVEPFTSDVCAVSWAVVPTAATYKIEVVNPSDVVVRTVTGLRTTTFEYTKAMGAEDGGPWRTFTIRVYAVGAFSDESGYAELEVSNPQIAALTGVTVSGMTNSVHVAIDPPTETDLAGFVVHMSTTDGFTPGPTTQVYDGGNTVFAISVDPGGTYYFRVAGYDTWGKDGLNYTSQFTAVPGRITTTEIADDAISTPKLQANSVTADKVSVSELSAISANMGTVTIGMANIQDLTVNTFKVTENAVTSRAYAETSSLVTLNDNIMTEIVNVSLGGLSPGNTVLVMVKLNQTFGTALNAYLYLYVYRYKDGVYELLSSSQGIYIGNTAYNQNYVTFADDAIEAFDNRVSFIVNMGAGHIFATSGAISNTYLSDDSGENWLNQFYYSWVLAQDFNVQAILDLGSGTVLIGVQQGYIYRVTGYGIAIDAPDAISPDVANDWIALISTGAGILAMTEAATHYSSNAGATWSAAMAYSGNCLCYLSSTSCLRGDSLGRIYRSTAAPWSSWATEFTSSVTTPSVRQIIDLGGGIALAFGWGQTGGGAIDAGFIARTTNYGDTWTEVVTTPRWWSGAAKHIGSGVVIFVANGYIARSADYGASWTYYANSNIPTFTYVAATARIVVLDSGAILLSAHTSLLKSLDNGVTWALVRDFGSIIGAVENVGSGTVLLGAGNAGEIYISYDFGNIWQLKEQINSTIYTYSLRGKVNTPAGEYIQVSGASIFAMVAKK